MRLDFLLLWEHLDLGPRALDLGTPCSGGPPWIFSGLPVPSTRLFRWGLQGHFRVEGSPDHRLWGVGVLEGCTRLLGPWGAGGRDTGRRVKVRMIQAVGFTGTY